MNQINSASEASLADFVTIYKWQTQPGWNVQFWQTNQCWISRTFVDQSEAETFAQGFALPIIHQNNG